MFSEKDKRGNWSIDCTECVKGRNGDQSCAAGTRVKKGGLGSCFNGELLDKYKTACECDTSSRRS